MTSQPGGAVGGKAVGKVSIYSPLEARVPIHEGYRRAKMIFLAGPTGCGKTDLSLMLAKEIGGEIVSADSMQVYRHMDIGTAKVTLEQRTQVPHHMIDIRDVSDTFNVVDFYYEAQSACERIMSRGKIPIVVGGAGFYLHTLLYGPPAGPPSVAELRGRIESEMDELGADALYQRLVEKDPDYAATITSNDRHKIVRALEIIALTGFPVSSHSWKNRTPSVQGSFRCWFLFRPRPVLYQRVEARCDQMLAEGFLDEVKKLEALGLRGNSSAAQAIGYRQALEFLSSDQTEDDQKDFLETFKKASRHYVKRQFTWFRQEPLFKWLDADAHDPEVLVDLMVRDSNAM